MSGSFRVCGGFRVQGSGSFVLCRALNRYKLRAFSVSSFPLGNDFVCFCLCKAQEEIKHVVVIEVLRGV